MFLLYSEHMLIYSASVRNTPLDAMHTKSLRGWCDNT